MQDIFVLFAKSKHKAALFHVKHSQLHTGHPVSLTPHQRDIAEWAWECFHLLNDHVGHGPARHLWPYLTPVHRRTYPQFIFHRLAVGGMEAQSEMPLG